MANPWLQRGSIMRIRTFVRGVTLTLTFVAFALVLSTCGGKQSSVIGPQSSDNRVAPAIQPTADISLDAALAEIDAYPCPEDVNPVLFEELKDALREALANNPPGEEPGWLARRTLEVSKLVSMPPTHEINAVTELGFAKAGTDAVEVSFREVHPGDYDNDGLVGIADITPIAQIYGFSAEDGLPEVVLARVDGDGDGRVGISDITPIAQNYGTDVAAYRLERGPSPEGPWEDAAGGQEMVRPDTEWDEREYPSPLLVPQPTYAFTDTVDLSELTYYRAVVYGVTDEVLERGTEGEAVLIDDLVPPVWTDTIGVTSVETAGDNELAVSWGLAEDSRSEPVTYNLYYSTTSPVVPASSARIAGLSGTEATVTGLSGTQEYYFIVRAEDAAGNEDYNTVELPGIPSGEPIEDTEPPYWVDPEKVGVYDVNIDLESETMTVYFGEADDLLSPPVKYRLIVDWQFEYNPSWNPTTVFDGYVGESPFELPDMYANLDEGDRGIGIYFARVLAYDQVGNENDEDERYWASPSGWQIERLFHSDEWEDKSEEGPDFDLDTYASLDKCGEPVFVLKETLRGPPEPVRNNYYAVERDAFGEWTSTLLLEDITAANELTDFGWAPTDCGPVVTFSFANPERTKVFTREQAGSWQMWETPVRYPVAWGPTIPLVSSAGLVFSVFDTELEGERYPGAYVMDIESLEIWYEDVGRPVPAGPFGLDTWATSTPDGRPVIHGNNVSSNAFYFERDTLERESGWTGRVWNYPEYPWARGGAFEGHEVFFNLDGNPVTVIYLEEEYQGHYIGGHFMERVDGEWTILDDPRGFLPPWRSGPMDDGGYGYEAGKWLSVYGSDSSYIGHHWLWGIGTPQASSSPLVNRKTERIQVPWVIDDEDIPQEWWGVYLLTSPSDFPYPVFY